MKKSTSKSKSKLIIESKLGPLFVMTVGEWKKKGLTIGKRPCVFLMLA